MIFYDVMAFLQARSSVNMSHRQSIKLCPHFLLETKLATNNQEVQLHGCCNCDMVQHPQVFQLIVLVTIDQVDMEQT